MKILFDHCVPKPFRRSLPTHNVRTTAEMGWQNLQNGKLLAQAALGNFEIFLTVDKNLRFQQNLPTLPIAVVILDTPANTPEALSPFAPFVEATIPTTRPGQMFVIDASGTVTRII